MALKIVKYVDKKGGHRWSIRSRNGKVIADSAESYTTESMRDKGLAALLTAIHQGDFKTVTEAPASKLVAVKKAAKKTVAKKDVKAKSLKKAAQQMDMFSANVV